MTFRDDLAKLWITLKKHYYEPAALQRKLDLKTSLMLLKMSEAMFVQDYLQQMQQLVVELSCVGEKIPDKELVQIILRNLPKSWNNFMAEYGVILSQDNKSDFQLASLQEYMQAEESRRRARQFDHEQSLIAANNFRRTNTYVQQERHTDGANFRLCLERLRPRQIC
ncbi:unnamed protein product [Calypogeia fissa]